MLIKKNDLNAANDRASAKASPLVASDFGWEGQKGCENEGCKLWGV